MLFDICISFNYQGPRPGWGGSRGRLPPGARGRPVNGVARQPRLPWPAALPVYEAGDGSQVALLGVLSRAGQRGHLRQGAWGQEPVPRGDPAPVHPELQTALTAATSFGTVGQGRLIDVSRVTVWTWVQQAVLRATEAGQIPQGRSSGTPTLRHSFARHMLLNGIPLNYLSRWLGHGRIQTTLVYLELAPDLSGSLASVP